VSALTATPERASRARGRGPTRDNRRGPGMDRRLNLTGWAFLAPAAILIVLVNFVPMIQAFILSLQSGRGTNLTFADPLWYNYQRLFGDEIFKQTLVNTFIYLIVQVPIMLILAMILANLLNNPNLKAKAFWRTAIFLPAAVSLVSYSLVFRTIFATDGFMNDFLALFSVPPVNWLGEPETARFVLILGLLWRWTGYNMIFYLAALQNVDRSIYEAARIDGVPAWARFFYITLPMLKPVILFTTVISTIGTLQLFDEPYNITQGGPADATLTLSYYIYNLTFKFMPSFGYSATVSWVIVVLVGILSFAQFLVARDRRAR